MGNPHRPTKDWHNTPPRPIADGVPGGGGVVVVDEVTVPTWTVTLEDLTAVADELRPNVVVRGEWAPLRFSVSAGRKLVGFVSAADSATIRQAVELYGGHPQGRVLSASSKRVVVELSLEGL